MTRFVLIALAAGVAGLPAFAADVLSQGERDRAISELQASRKLFLDSIDGLSGAQWTFKPGPERWSAAEIAEHVIKTEEAIIGMIREKLLKSPSASAEEIAAVKGKDQRILTAVPERTTRVKTSPALEPSGKYETPQTAADRFRELRDADIDWVEKTQENLRAHIGPHPALGPMDAYQWILLVAAHTERHVNQIREVQADPNYPR